MIVRHKAITFSLVILLLILSIYVLYNVNADDAKFDGYAVEHFEDVGAWGWLVSVKNVTNGPQDMAGRNISVYMTSANPDEYPPGFIDPDIAIGDHVSVYGSLQSQKPGDYHILLVGSKKYYLKRDLF
jgi:hypothetical protein